MVKVPDVEEEEDRGPPASRLEEELDDNYSELELVGMGDVELAHVRLVHEQLAVASIYFTGHRFEILKLVREGESERTQRISVFYIRNTGHTCPVLLREGTKDNGGERTFGVAQYGEIVEEAENLVRNHGFEIADVGGNWLRQDLPQDVLPEDESKSKTDDFWNSV